MTSILCLIEDRLLIYNSKVTHATCAKRVEPDLATGYSDCGTGEYPLFQKEINSVYNTGRANTWQLSSMSIYEFQEHPQSEL